MWISCLTMTFSLFSCLFFQKRNIFVFKTRFERLSFGITWIFSLIKNILANKSRIKIFENEWDWSGRDIASKKNQHLNTKERLKFLKTVDASNHRKLIDWQCSRIFIYFLGNNIVMKKWNYWNFKEY